MNAWKRRPLPFRIFAVFYSLIGALEYATFPLMMFCIVSVKVHWAVISSVLLFFFLPTLMRPLEKFLVAKGEVFALEELSTALEKNRDRLEGTDASRLYHMLSRETGPFKDYYRESLGFYGSAIYIIVSLGFNLFALPRSLNITYILGVPILAFIMLMSEDRMTHIAERGLKIDNREREELIKLLYLSRGEMGKEDTEKVIENRKRALAASDRCLKRGVTQISLLSFAEFTLVFFYFFTLYWTTRYSLELTVSLFLSLPVFIEGIKAVSDVTRHFLRAKALSTSIYDFTSKKEETL